jgi:photosystem II stability/assembly factor-like uncharacterized protein
MTRLFLAFEDRLLRVKDREGHWSASTVLAEPTLAGADVETVAVHPDRPSQIFCGTFGRGLLRSDDGGETWERRGEDTFDSAAVTAVAVDPTDPAVVYVGIEPSRVYRSTDGGDTWAHREGLTDLPSASTWSFPPRPSTHHVRWIDVDPHDPATLYVSIEAGALLRSVDAGTTWQDRITSERRDVHSITTHQDAPGHVWVASGDGYGVSTDGGDTWATPEAGLDVGYCWSVAVDPDEPETVLLSAARGSGPAHQSARAESFVFRKQSDDPWERIGDGLPTGDGVLRYELESGSTAGEIFAVTNVGPYRTTDAGDSWTRLTTDWPPELETQKATGIAVVT